MAHQGIHEQSGLPTTGESLLEPLIYCDNVFLERLFQACGDSDLSVERAREWLLPDVDDVDDMRVLFAERAQILMYEKSRFAAATVFAQDLEDPRSIWGPVIEASVMSDSLALEDIIFIWNLNNALRVNPALADYGVIASLQAEYGARFRAISALGDLNFIRPSRDSVQMLQGLESLRRNGKTVALPEKTMDELRDAVLSTTIRAFISTRGDTSESTFRLVSLNTLEDLRGGRDIIPLTGNDSEIFDRWVTNLPLLVESLSCGDPQNRDILINAIVQKIVRDVSSEITRIESPREVYTNRNYDIDLRLQIIRLLKALGIDPDSRKAIYGTIEGFSTIPHPMDSPLWSNDEAGDEAVQIQIIAEEFGIDLQEQN